MDVLTLLPGDKVEVRQHRRSPVLIPLDEDHWHKRDQGKYRPSSKTWKAAVVVRVEGDGSIVVVRFSGYKDDATLPAAQVWANAEGMCQRDVCAFPLHVPTIAFGMDTICVRELNKQHGAHKTIAQVRRPAGPSRSKPVKVPLTLDDVAGFPPINFVKCTSTNAI